MREHCFRNILCQCCLQCCVGEQMEKKQKIFCFGDANFASATCVAWIRKRGNSRETFKVNVFLQRFPNVSSFAPPCDICCQHKICVLKPRHVLEIFQKHFSLPRHNFVSATMLLRLRRSLTLGQVDMVTLVNGKVLPIATGE